MAITITPLGLDGALKMIADTDIDGTAENNVNAGAATLLMADLDNAANGAVSYFKGYNNAAPTVGTTAPELILMLPASGRRSFYFYGGLTIFATALSFCAVTTAGTAGTTNPTSNVDGVLVIE